MSAISTREFWLGAGAAVVAGFVACVALFATCHAVGSFATEYSVRTEVPSPTGEQRAILYMGMGGGAAGWCYQHLAVARAGATFDPRAADSELEYVFSASCGSQVTPRWLSELELEVSYSLDRSSGTSLYQRPHTPDGLVRLTFIPQSRRAP
jgi:hypothetical protein